MKFIEFLRSIFFERVENGITTVRAKIPKLTTIDIPELEEFLSKDITREKETFLKFNFFKEEIAEVLEAWEWEELCQKWDVSIPYHYGVQVLWDYFHQILNPKN